MLPIGSQGLATIPSLFAGEKKMGDIMKEIRSRIRRVCEAGRDGQKPNNATYNHVDGVYRSDQ